MDLDIEMDVDDFQDIPQIPEAYTQDIITGEEQEPGEVDEDLDNHALDSQDNELALNKVHIQGLDTFKPDDVRTYLKEHSADANFERIEWINDTSANFIFRSESAARDALIAIAAVGIADPTQLAPREMVPAKTYAQKPESYLQVRYAVASDKKPVGAAAYSRFYLLNPEYDPEERRRRGEFGRGKYRDREDRNDRSRRRNDRYREPRSEEPETFAEDFYDEKSTAPARPSQPSPRRRRRSSSPGSQDRSRDTRNRAKELFPDRRGSGRLRDRSASPVRDRDADAQMDLDEDVRAAAALRSREKGRSLREQLSRDTRAKELFPEKARGTKKELFPSKVSSAGSKAQMDQVNDATVLESAKLADRVTARPTAPVTSSAGGISILGMANKRGSDQGISIKGMGCAPTVKELFPEKFGNSGKELFAEKIAGRGQKRQKAADSFY